MDRRLIEVIERMRQIIPEDEVVLLKELGQIEADLSYKAPEQEQPFWNLAAQAIRRNFPPVREQFEIWHEQVIKVWTNT